MAEPCVFEFPLSLVPAISLVACIFMLYRISPGRILVSRYPASALLSAMSVFLAIGGTLDAALFHHWTFLAAIVITLLALGLVSIRDFSHKSIRAFLSHSGLFLVLSGGFFGAPDATDALMRVYEGGSGEQVAVDAAGNAVPLPFAVSLEKFRIDYYEDGVSPMQYTSTLSVDGTHLETSVNHPCRYKGYVIYQSGYDTEEGRYSVLKIVREPWLPIIVAGALMLLAGALLSLMTVWSGWKVFATALALAAVFCVISVAGISFGTLAPALRSWWFVPHLVLYMLAYSALALASVIGIASLFPLKIPCGLPDKLLATSSSLLLTGMLCGAVWAGQSWGDYWNWDAKECWAAVTWLLTLAGTHIPGRKAGLAFTVAAFLAMQVTWYGVDYFPASSRSLHTYRESPVLAP